MKKLWRLLGKLIGTGCVEDAPISPTGQRQSEILAMRDRAEKETDEARRRRLEVDDSLSRKTPARKDHCPLCGIEVVFDLEPGPEDDPYVFDTQLIHSGNGECPFCKAQIAVLFDRNGEMIIRDKKWDAECQKFYDKEDETGNKIEDLETDLEDDDLTEKQQAAIRLKIKKLEDQLSAAEKMFEDKESKYHDRQSRWEEKTWDKFEGSM